YDPGAKVSSALPASQAMAASTANSGNVWSQASIASARPWEIRNCAASAAHEIRIADPSTAGKVQTAEAAPCRNASLAATGFVIALKRVSFTIYRRGVLVAIGHSTRSFGAACE